MLPRILSAVLSLCACASGLNAQTLSPHDISAIRLASDVRLSPDARRVAFVIAEPAESARATRRSGIWTVATHGSAPPRPLISGGDDNSPRWSPDGTTLAFLSARADAPGSSAPTSQIYRVGANAEGAGAPERLSSAEGDVDDFAWSPDGRFIAFTVREPAVEQDPAVADKSLQYTRLGIVSVGERTTSALTGRDFDVQEFAWSADGNEIALVIAPTPRPEDQFQLGLVVLNRQTGKIVRRLSENVAFAGLLTWSPDGRLITFRECPPARKFASWLAVIPAAGGTVRPLLKDRRSTTLRAEWAADSRHLVLLTVEGTGQALVDLDIESGRVRRIADVVNSQFEFGFSTDGKTIAYLGQSASSPSDVWLATSDPPPRRLTDLNPQTPSWRLGAVQAVHWKNSEDGLERSGVLITPPGFEAGRAYPTIVQAHPGDAPWWEGWLSNWWAWGQLLASRGYVVFLPNTRGVTGEGWKLNATIGDWGGMAFQDLIDGVDALVARGIADPERLGIGGWSNGGFMTEWTITHTTRFKAAVAEAGHSDFFSLYGTSYSRAPLAIAFGDPYANRAVYDAHSPITFIRSCRTPTLVLHGANDAGVPVGQGSEFYTGLKAMGVEAEMVVYPREGHGIRERGHQEDLQNRVLAWFDGHLK
jgi:dipeptidyl aminopeptidase/acylaminoacyl peptidase